MMDKIRNADRAALAWGTVALSIVFFLAMINSPQCGLMLKARSSIVFDIHPPFA